VKSTNYYIYTDKFDNLQQATTTLESHVVQNHIMANGHYQSRKFKIILGSLVLQHLNTTYICKLIGIKII
jgi:hypothetical protein